MNDKELGKQMLKNNIMNTKFDKKIRELMSKYSRLRDSIDGSDECEKILSLAELDILVRDIKNILLIKYILDKAPDQKTLFLALNIIRKEVEETDVIKPLLKKFDSDLDLNNNDKSNKSELKAALKIVETAKHQVSKLINSFNNSLDT